MKKLFVFTLFVAAFSQAFGQDKLQESIDRGQQVYAGSCMSCHMENGEGVEGAFPPLVKTEWVTGDVKKLVRIILQGQSGEITVNGDVYNMDMPPQAHLSDQEVADVANYIRNSWGNKASKVVTSAEVESERTE